MKFRDQPISRVTSEDENKYHRLSEGQLMRFIYIHGEVLVFRLLLFRVFALFITMCRNRCDNTNIFHALNPLSAAMLSLYNK